MLLHVPPLPPRQRPGGDGDDDCDHNGDDADGYEPVPPLPPRQRQGGPHHHRDHDGDDDGYKHDDCYDVSLRGTPDGNQDRDGDNHTLGRDKGVQIIIVLMIIIIVMVMITVNTSIGMKKIIKTKTMKN